MFELFPHDPRVADTSPQHRLVDDGRQFQRGALAVQDPLPGQPELGSAHRLVIDAHPGAAELRRGLLLRDVGGLAHALQFESDHSAVDRGAEQSCHVITLAESPPRPNAGETLRSPTAIRVGRRVVRPPFHPVRFPVPPGRNRS